MRPEIATLCATYAAIAETMPQAVIERGEGYEIATGPFAHPLCNYGIILDASAIRTVLGVATGRAHFNIYSFESIGTFEVPGYRPMVSMATMTSPPTADGGDLPQIVEAAARLRVARFMTDQFFSTSLPAVKERVAQATAAAKGTSIFALEESQSELVGAAMLSNHTLMAGLYNVCVLPEHRGQGIGSRLVQLVRNVASRESRSLTLQCALTLRPWYERLGFRQVDTMTVWSVEV